MKSVLDQAGLAEAVEEAALVRAGYEDRFGNEIGEVLSPLIYGVLAHTHQLPGPDPQASVTKVLLKHAETTPLPREQLDIVCVADLDCWYRLTNLLQHVIGSTEPSEHDLYFDYWNSASTIPAITGTTAPENANPIATLVTQLWAKLSTRNPQLRPIADGLRVTGTGSHGGEGRQRPLKDVISTALHKNIFRGGSNRWLM